jgi:hypothetical protein
LSAPTDKLLVFLTEGPEGWDTPIADLVAACGDMGQPAMLIDLTKPDASALLNKAASAGVTAFVSMEGVGSRMTANGRSIYELLQAPLLTFLPDHPCFYAPLLTTPQKLVVPLFFSQEHVAAARGIYGNVPLAPVVEPWGPRSLELEGKPVPAVFVDANVMSTARALASEPPRTVELVDAVRKAFAGRSEDVFRALSIVLEERWIPMAALAPSQRSRLCQWTLCLERTEELAPLVDSGAIVNACGSGWPSPGSSLAPLPPSGVPSFAASIADQAFFGSDVLRRARLSARRTDRSDSSASPLSTLVRAAESAVFLDVALAGMR